MTPAQEGIIQQAVYAVAGKPCADDDIRAVVATCSMYNQLFKTVEFAPQLGSRGVGLRGHALNSLPELERELVCIVVSVINSCRFCTTGHVKASGLSDAAILEAMQHAATVYGDCIGA